MKKGLINQYGGLGDIIFCYKIAHSLIDRGLVDIVYWPVPDRYLCLNYYFDNKKIIFCEDPDAEPQVNHVGIAAQRGIFSGEETIETTEDYLYLPLTHHTYNGDNQFDMCEKYKFSGLDPEDRQSCINLRRDKSREQKLIDFLGVEPSDELTLANLNLGTPPHSCSRHPDIKIDAEKLLYIEYLDFDSVFDWIPYILACKRFYTVETSFSHLADLLGKENVTVLPRFDPSTGNNSKSLEYCKKYYNKKWNFIET